MPKSVKKTSVKPVKKSAPPSKAKPKKGKAAAGVNPTVHSVPQGAGSAAGKLAEKPVKPAVKPKTTAKPPPKSKKNHEPDLDDTLLVDDIESSEVIPELDDFEEDEEILENLEASEEDSLDDEDSMIPAASRDDDEIILTDAEGRRLCRVRDCDQAAIVELYCRFHYLQNWKRIQVRRKILADGKLERYVDELTSRYPDKFLEMIRKDVRTEKDFLVAIAELEIDESGIDNDFEDESQSFIDEVRGVNESSISEDDEF